MLNFNFWWRGATDLIFKIKRSLDL